jgi:hypothetical protein
MFGYRIEEITMGVFGEVNGNNPFEAITRRTAEEKLGVEILVKEQLLTQIIEVVQVVEVDAHQARVLNKGIGVALGKYAREAAIVEAVRLEALRLGFVRDGTKVGGALLSGFAYDVEVGIKQGDGLVGHGAGDGGTEEGENRDFRFFFFCAIVIRAFVLTTEV